MKKILIFCCLTTILLISYSCSNDFELNAPWKDVPVVYGLLSKQDTAHYIRVEKAFLDPTTSALEIAQRPDSLYYENASVRLEQINGEAVIKSFDLAVVDGNDEGYVREEGVFASAPNFLYKLKLPENETLIDGEDYRFILNRGENLPEVTAEATLLSDILIANPQPGVVFKWATSTTRQIIQWRFEPEDAVFFDVKMNISYEEADASNPTDFTPKKLVWDISSNIVNETGDNTLELRFFSSEFFQFLAFSLPAETNTIRRLTNLEIRVDGGGVDLFEYINVGRANTGITSSQIIPTYTNLSEGFGIISSRSTSLSGNHLLEGAALDSLRSGFRTAALNFQ